MSDTEPEMNSRPPVLSDTVRVGSPTVLNGMRQGVGRMAAQTRTIRARADQEYVSNGTQLFAVNYLRSLSFAVDDITADFGDDLYDRMLMDSEVGSCIDQIVMAVLAHGITVTAPIEPTLTDDAGESAPNPEYAEAKEIADFIRRQLSDMTGTFDPDSASPLYWAVYDLLRTGIACGNKIAENVFVIAREGVDAGRVCLKAIKPKPRRTAAFVVDTFNNVQGILGLIPGQGSPGFIQGAIGGVDIFPNILPRQKFCVFTWRPRDGDPRGTAILRKAYDAWFVKQQIKIERLRWLAQLAGGGIIGFTAEQAGDTPAIDANNQPIFDANGVQVTSSPAQVMADQLVKWRNGSVAAFPFGSLVDVHYPAPESPFDAALDRQDREISTAITGQTRMSKEAQHGSKADSETAQDVFQMTTDQGAMAGALMLTRDLVAPLVLWNFGAAKMHLCPVLSLKATEQQDVTDARTAAASLKTSGYLAPSQYQDLDAELKLSVRTDAEVSAMQEAADASLKALTDPPKPADAGAKKPPAKTTN